jgi:TPR repeat protein
MGLLYECGKGVGKDCEAATNNYRLAAQQGHLKALYGLATLYERSDSSFLLLLSYFILLLLLSYFIIIFYYYCLIF